MLGILICGFSVISGWAKTIGDATISVQLNPDKGFRLESLTSGGVEFASGGDFPTFLLFDKNGADRAASAQSSFFTDVRKESIPDGIRIVYVAEGFSISVSYQLLGGRLLILVKPESEELWKIRAVTDKGALVAVPSTATGAQETAFVLRPYLGGELIRFSDSREVITDTQPQSWDYNASFIGLGLRDRGIILRSPLFGAQWTAGQGNVRGIFSLSAGVTLDFRPRRDQPGAYSYWNLALCEPMQQLELIPVGDVTGDGWFSWADVGVDYRRRFIRRNQHLDPHIPGAVMGKIDLSQPYKDPKKYDELIDQIRSITYAPQIWWLVGAHTGPEFDFVAPPHSVAPDPGHNGKNGYDYFQFKQDALKAGARIGLHEIFDDTSVLNPTEWKKVPMRMQEFGETVGTWSCKLPNGENFSAVSRALRPLTDNGAFVKEFGEHLKPWRTQPGDTWHWDVFTSVGGRSDFHPQHPVTHGMDLRDRIEILRQIQKTGIFLTNESMQEGLAEFSSYAWVTKAAPVLTSKFPGGRGIPLMPVLFQGTTYYGTPWKPAWGLLMGGNTGSESTTLAIDRIEQEYFGHNTFWSKICDRTIRNVTEIEDGWKVEYDQGGSLKVNLKDMTFNLEVDGVTYTAENPPASPFGYTAKMLNGHYEVIPPANQSSLKKSLRYSDR